MHHTCTFLRLPLGNRFCYPSGHLFQPQPTRGSTVQVGPARPVQRQLMSPAFWLLGFLLLALPALVQAQTVQSFSFTGAAQTFTVPAGVTKIHVVAYGASGKGFLFTLPGSGGTFTFFIDGAKGGKVEADLAVTPGQTLNIYVGGQATTLAGGYNGGGATTGGAFSPYGGNGATDIRIGGILFSNRVLVAGGAGAGTFPGDGGGSSGADGMGGAFGKGDTQNGGGAGGVATSSGSTDGQPGSSGTGGDGGTGASNGGGGGGYYGGGGGAEGGDGGGGSGYADATLATNVVQTVGANTGDGSLTISYTTPPTPPTRLYVNAAATGTSDGLTWGTAFTDLQSALTYPNSVSLTEIWVAGGTYKPTTGTDRTVSFRMLPNVAVYGGFPNNGTPTFADRNPASFSTILSGDINTTGNNTDNSYHVVYYGPGSGAPVLDGVIIRGGNADGQNTTGNPQDDNGGGMLINSTATTSSTLCNPQLTNVTFEGNSGQRNGGALYLFANGAEASPVLTNCRFISNTATSNNGGAIFTEGKSSGLSNMVLTDCLFRQNVSDSDGGALYLDIDKGGTRIERGVFDRNTCDDEGGAIYAYEGSFTLTGSQFLSNTSGYYGGAIFQDADEYGLVDNCLFDGNTAPTNRGGAYYYKGDSQGGCDLRNSTFQNNAADRGGAIYVNDPGLRIINCLVKNNTSTDGGGIYNVSSLMLINTTVASNSITGTQGGGIYSSSSITRTVSLINTIIWGNMAAGAAIDRQLYRSVGTVSLQNSLVQDGLPTGVVDAGSNNLTTSVSPFVSATDLRLNGCSPAINAGNSSATGLTGITTDLGGQPRIFGSAVDMGAFEFQGAANLQTGITAQPIAGTSITTGGTATASISVSGTGGFTYQWYKDGPSGVPVVVSGQTSATLTVSNATTASAGSYSAVVTGACNSVTSTAFSLSVTAPITSISNISVPVLNAATCPATMTAKGTGKRFEITGPNNIRVFTLNFRTPVSDRDISFTGMNQPGVYTVRVYDAAGQFITTTFTVTGAGCP